MMSAIDVEEARELPELLASLGATAAAQHRVLAAPLERQARVRARLAVVAARHPHSPVCTLTVTLNVLAGAGADAAAAARLIGGQLEAATLLLRLVRDGHAILSAPVDDVREGVFEALRDLMTLTELELGPLPPDTRARYDALLGDAAAAREVC